MTFAEKRRFYRIQSQAPISFCECEDENVARLVKGHMANISQAGIAFRTNRPPAVSRLIWIQLELKDVQICEEIEKNALITDKGLLGRVVHIEEIEEESRYEVGVSFVTKDDAAAGKYDTQV